MAVGRIALASLHGPRCAEVREPCPIAIRPPPRRMLFVKGQMPAVTPTEPISYRRILCCLPRQDQ